MNTVQLVWKNITQQWGSTLLSIILTGFGVAILCSIYITSDSIEKQLTNNSKQVDLVVGAKGSPLQLILSALYHVDNPTGNILLSEAEKLKDNPMIDMTVPISLGDNFKGHRIVGTDSSFLSMYALEIHEGQLWKKSYEIVLGSETAKRNNLKIGDQVLGAHGLAENAHIHDEHPFTVVGILKPSGSIVDKLILSNLESVWDVHGIAHDDHEHEHADDHENPSDSPKKEATPANDAETIVAEKPRDNNFVKSIADDLIKDKGLEITALLVKYRTPAAIGVIPKLINQSTSMQAASPALESARLFSLLGVGIDSLEILAYVIMIIAGLSVFISLYNALKDRQYDLAIMRAMGASKFKLFNLLIVEGLVITCIGGLLGLVLGHAGLYYIGTQTSQSGDFINAFKVYPMEWLILLGACLIGIIASIIPAIKAYQTTISTILGNK